MQGFFFTIKNPFPFKRYPMKNYVILVVFFLLTMRSNAQELDTLKNIIISSSRIDLPFKENSRTIQIVTAER